MIGNFYDPFLTPNELVARQRMKSYPTREELLSRNSFKSVNQNKYLDLILRGVKK